MQGSLWAHNDPLASRSIPESGPHLAFSMSAVMVLKTGTLKATLDK